MLESADVYGLLYFTPGGSGNGSLLAFQDATPDIAYFQISGDNIAMTNISLVTPEPTTWLLCGLGLLAAARSRHCGPASKVFLAAARNS